MVSVDATEKLYADYRLLVTNPGGHSSLPARTMRSITWRKGSRGWRTINLLLS